MGYFLFFRNLLIPKLVIQMTVIKKYINKSSAIIIKLLGRLPFKWFPSMNSFIITDKGYTHTFLINKI